MITVESAQVYSIKGGKECAYQIDYSDGTKVRAVEGSGIIRKEALMGGEWKLSGKPYVVEHSRKRQAEKIKAMAVDFINA